MDERDIDAAALFHLNSSNVRNAIGQLAPDPERKPAARRIHAGARRIALPGADLELPLPLGLALAGRRSRREFAPAALPQELLGRLLFASAAVTGTVTYEGFTSGARTYPSGGALYPLEIYPVLQQVEGIADGIYHYDPWNHELEEVRAGNFHQQFAAMTIGQGMLAGANAVFFITAVFERSMWKYGQRGYRYTWIEAGHLGQNLYLVAGALGLAPVALGGFYDGEANALLDLAPNEQTIYAMCAGVPRS
ncbi:MAG TPA: SagB/ThcOx family dehydrogenase [Thermoanaerobaculia bacterium]|nr:SagB/ThcOx family dehydrogenase [Thermoanaerobaculia bacterium]